MMNEDATLTLRAPMPVFRRAGQRLGLDRRRGRAAWAVALALAFFLALALGAALTPALPATDLLDRTAGPSLAHPFGTDWLGRDMLARTANGMVLSLSVGLLAATVSALVALVLGTLAATSGRAVDTAVMAAVDAGMALPHLLLLILISFAMGGGPLAVTVAVATTHWPRLTRIIRAEVLQLRESEFVRLSPRLGRRAAWTARWHLLPHVFPQFLVGLLLLFPHAILHEAALTFLGFGLPPHSSAVGVLLNESMRYLATGAWWLGVLPGLALLAMVKAFDVLGTNARTLLSARTSQE